jgi:hypothetical protein
LGQPTKTIVQGSKGDLMVMMVRDGDDDGAGDITIKNDTWMVRSGNTRQQIFGLNRVA